VDGPGVPPDASELVFERFATLDEHGGSGLGLAIARELARVQGGELTYEHGVFVVRLPARATAGEPA
jgi:signal transduction histidine kinase